MARYTYDHCVTGSWHEGGLGSTDDLATAIREAAKIDGLGPECYATVYDTQTSKHITWRSRGDDGARTSRRVRAALAKLAADDWTLPAHRPPKDAAGPRQFFAARLSARARLGFAAEAKRTGGSVGDLLTRIGEGLAE